MKVYLSYRPTIFYMILIKNILPEYNFRRVGSSFAVIIGVGNEQLKT